MRLSTSTNIYFNRPDGSKASIEDSMKRCAAAGYRVMDMNFHDCTTFRLPFVGDAHESWINGIAELAATLNLEFSQAHAPFYNFCDDNFTDRERMDRLILRAIDHAAVLRIPWVVIHAGTDFKAAKRIAASKEKNLAYFLPLVEYAAKRGVGIAVENLWDLNISPLRRYTTEVEELMDFVEAFPKEIVGVCYDVGHGTIMGQDHRLNLQLMGDRLKATHVSDCFNIDSDHMLPYTGKTDWNCVMQALREISYQGDFTYEIHRYTATMPDALVQQALAHSVAVGEHLINLSMEEL